MSRLSRSVVDARLRPILRRLPRPLKARLRRLAGGRRTSATPHADSVSESAASEYGKKVAEEVATFADKVEVHDLPPIYHYWSNAHLAPMLAEFDIRNPDHLFAKYMAQTVGENRLEVLRVVSLGSGNCDTEVRVATQLRSMVECEFTIECVDLNPVMLARGQARAAESGVADHIRGIAADFNRWTAEPASVHVVMANQSLHHVLELENLFEAIDRSLTASGRFVTSDMIGRNAHMRWPEAHDIVSEFWSELPTPYRWNVQLGRQEDELLDWDCSSEGFEGVRSQDILPALIDRFDFELFVPFGNVIDPFIDRSFGPHFDRSSPTDRAFIDRVHSRDEMEISAGRITPTHMVVVLRRWPYEGVCAGRVGLTPEFCVRRSS